MTTAQRIPEFEVDHVAAAVDSLPVAFRTPLTLAIVKAFAARLQVIWDAQRTVLDALDLTSDTGETYPFALVPWGVALGQPRRATWTPAVWRRVLKNKEHEIADLTRDRDRLEGRLAVARQDTECEGACHPEVECDECGHSNAHIYTVRTGY